VDRAWGLRGHLTFYDALYVALAEVLDAPLVTFDARIAGAPGAVARIEVLSADA
jgi:predicted nucleic acid-binding protein